MDKMEKRFASILLFTAFSIFISGCFFREFLLYIWTSTMQVYAVGHGPYLAVALFVYFVMFAMLGVFTGLIVYHYAYVVNEIRRSIWMAAKHAGIWLKTSLLKAKA